MAKRNTFLRQEDLPLFTSGTRFAIADVLIHAGLEKTLATFDLSVRDLPKNRNYLIFTGLEKILRYLQELRFRPEHIRWIQQSYHFDQATLRLLRNLRFTGDVWAMREGTLFFPGEPILRITAPLIEAQLVEMYVLNALYYPLIFAAKLARFLTAANGKATAIGYNRSYGAEVALEAERIKELLGTLQALSLYTYRSRKPAYSVSTYHYFIKAFPNEREAFRVYLRRMKGRGHILIDTYDSIQGIRNFIDVAKELEPEGIRATGIQLDSGNRLQLSRIARRMLDQAGLQYVKIFAMGNFDEFTVEELERRRAPIDVYAGTTELMTPSDDPNLELVYKLSELEQNGLREPKMKTSTGKVSLPGRKQVYRVFRKGKAVRDVIGLEYERGPGRPLLEPVLRKGKLVGKLPSLAESRQLYEKERRKFNASLFSIRRKVRFPVVVSPRLRKLADETRRAIRKAHGR